MKKEKNQTCNCCAFIPLAANARNAALKSPEMHLVIFIIKLTCEERDEEHNLIYYIFIELFHSNYFEEIFYEGGDEEKVQEMIL